MKRDTTNDMTVGNPVSLIIKFMIPMCLGNLFQQFYNLQYYKNDHELAYRLIFP